MSRLYFIYLYLFVMLGIIILISALISFIFKLDSFKIIVTSLLLLTLFYCIMAGIHIIIYFSIKVKSMVSYREVEVLRLKLRSNLIRYLFYPKYLYNISVLNAIMTFKRLDYVYNFLITLNFDELSKYGNKEYVTKFNSYFAKYIEAHNNNLISGG